MTAPSLARLPMRLSLLALCLLAGCASTAPAEPTDAEIRREAYADLRERGYTAEEAQAILTSAPGALEPNPLALRAGKESRADSLRALPPEALTDADARWLLVYAAERQDERAERDAEAREKAATAAQAYVGVSILLGVAGAVATYFLTVGSR